MTSEFVPSRHCAQFIYWQSAELCQNGIKQNAKAHRPVKNTITSSNVDV